MRRNLMNSETVAKSKFYSNSTKEVLNNTIATALTWQFSTKEVLSNTIATALTWQLFLQGLNKSAVQIVWEMLNIKHF